MKGKIIFVSLVMLILVVSGCASSVKLGGVQTLKQYYAHEPLKEGQNYMPLDLAARAKIMYKDKCSDVLLSEEIGNDCFIFGGDTIRLVDVEGYSREYSTSFGQIPFYLFDILQEGDTCNFIFDRYLDGNIIDANECSITSREDIENAKKESEESQKTARVKLFEGSSSSVLGKEIVLEKIKEDESIIISVNRETKIIQKGSDRIVDCLRINYYDNADNGRSIFLDISILDLCDDYPRFDV